MYFVTMDVSGGAVLSQLLLLFLFYLLTDFVCD